MVRQGRVARLKTSEGAGLEVAEAKDWRRVLSPASIARRSIRSGAARGSSAPTAVELNGSAAPPPCSPGRSRPCTGCLPATGLAGLFERTTSMSARLGITHARTSTCTCTSFPVAAEALSAHNAARERHDCLRAGPPLLTDDEPTPSYSTAARATSPPTRWRRCKSGCTATIHRT